YEIIVSYVGYADQSLKIDLLTDLAKDIELGEATEVLEEVVIVADREFADQNVESVSMSSVEMKVETIKKMPALLGEVDIIKAIQLLPGVKAVGEGGSGFYVRGGNADQNLILLDEAPIYNASHLLGFFSSFNPDAIKDMQLYKGAIPAYFGGRLSSVLDIRMKEGNAKRFAASGGIGTIMSRVAIEAPIAKNGSFMVAGRRSYLDWIAGLYNSVTKNEDAIDADFYFYDLNAKANYRLDANNRVFASGYFGRDVITIPDEGLDVRWGNTTATARWNHIFSPKLFSNLTYYYSKYDYFLNFSEDISKFTWQSKLKEHSLKADFGAFLNPSNTLKFGVQTILHEITPGDIESFENNELDQTFKIEAKKAYESAAYVHNTQTVNSRIKLEYGLRLSALHNFGTQDVYRQDENYQVIDTVRYTNSVYNSSWNLEPRVGLRYKLNASSSLKASYNRTAQYIQQASNGNSATPFDIWFLSSEQIKPQLADQFALGYFKNLKDNSIELSAEIYYKNFIRAIDFKDHARLLLNRNLEGELRVGEGRAYGIELMARKTKGKLTGWVSYTYSKAEKKIPTINEGNWYNAKYDKPHDIAVVAIYEVNDRFTVSGNFVYSTGSAVTFPTGRYVFQGVAVPVYSERNGARLPDYHRMDLSATYTPKKNKKRRLQTEYVLSIYNLYNRKNAFSINFKQDELDPSQTYAEKSAVFSIVPSFTFNVKF
ncbi:MAG: TonB-dependent receptor plug domain-containing protein, partial [Saprospiraceae bacterium]